MFQCFGQVYELPADRFAIATAMGGSHSAFVLWLIKVTAQFVGRELPEVNSEEFTRQIYHGVVALLDKNKNISTLLEQIVTPGGCTAVGLQSLETSKLREIWEKAFQDCAAKARTMELV